MTAAAASAARPAPPPRTKRNLSLLMAAAVVVWALVTVEVDVTRLAALPARLVDLVGRMFFPPAWDNLGRSLEAMLESLHMAWLGTVIGALLSLPLGFFGAKNITSGRLSTAMRQILNAIRAFPEIVLAVVVMIPIAGLGAPAGVLAIGVHSIGTLGKLTAEVIEGIDPGPVEAARAAGAGSVAVQRWGVLPQVLPEIVAFWLYRFEINIRAAAVLGIIGAGGIGGILQNYLQYRRWELAGMAVLVVIVATILIDTVSGTIRRRIIEGAEARRVVAEAIEQPEAAEVTERRR
ncbi:MAG: phosphonate ABC transporter, permease protein PhnE [Candidatus Limnocylindria bacterium]